MRAAVAVVCLVHVAVARADAPRDFTREVRTVYAVAACGEAAPAGFDAAIVAAHCKQVRAAIATWQANWHAKAAPFFAALHHNKYPASVVYPFGGGDLVTALAIYPDATDYTTVSLEGIGDPRAARALTDAPKQLAVALDKLRPTVTMSLGWAWNTTDQLSIESSDTRAGLPNILALTLIALVAHGYEPLEARYFTVDAKGTLVYLTADPPAEPTAERKATNAVQQGPFNDIEIVFRKQGDPNAPKKVFRHLAADLFDTGDTSALAYLATKGDVAAVTKAASYLLWKDSFSKIRDYLLANMQLMVSDDTGIPPRFAKPAGFTQDVWGQYTGSFFGFANQDVAKEMVALWRGSARSLPFRFGYYDNKRHPHLLFTHK